MVFRSWIVMDIFLTRDRGQMLTEVLTYKEAYTGNA